MFGPRLTGGLTFGKVLGGIGKTLNVINEVIPIYKEAKPLVSSARNAMNLLKEFGNTTTERVMNNTAKNIGPIKEKMQSITNINNNPNEKGLTFFQ